MGITNHTTTMTRTELVNALKNNAEVNFTYTKLNGERRQARGTLMEGIVPATTGGKKNRPADMIVYWDLDKNNWRSLHESQLA